MSARANGSARASVAGGSARRALVVCVEAGERELARIAGLSVGIMSASQGSYSRAQLLLDLSQGTRVADSAYPSERPPPLAIEAAGSSARVRGWGAAVARAASAPQIVTPGLLAGSVGGGGAYAGLDALDHLDALLAAGPQGSIAAFSLGSSATLLARIAGLRSRHAFIVADAAPGQQGVQQLRALARAAAPAGDLLIAIERVRGGPRGELLWSGAAGFGARGGAMELTSASTQERGLISSIDIAPTVLSQLALARPSEMRGAALHSDGPLRSESLRGLQARLRVIGGRRLRALGLLLLALALALLLCGRPQRRVVLRSGALALLWAPVASLLTAALEPSAVVEYALVISICVALGAVTAALLPWPRAPLLPALLTPLALLLDALAHSQLLMRSLLGPDPLLGARFYGIGNELKSALAVLVLAGVAAALYPARTSPRAAGAMALAGALLAAIEGSARIGAGVGGVILVCSGFALAAAMLLPGAATRRRALAVLAAPAAGLLALALLDLLTAHGSGHFSASVLHARSAGDLRDLIVRRYSAAWDELRNHAMPLATALALGAGLLGVRRRERLLAPVARDPGWSAALQGGLAAGVVGALVEDSGPVLLVVAVFTLGCVLSYLWAAPAAAPQRSSRSGPAAAPRALTRSAPP